MLKKRLIGVITVKDDWAVQSFGYRRHLPLGRPEVLAENLERWGADEILVQCIDCSRNGRGPNFPLLEQLGRMGLATPLIYAGGISTAEQAVTAVKAGAERIVADAALWDDPESLVPMAAAVGTQAVIAALPLGIGKTLEWHDYRSGRTRSLAGLGTVLEKDAVSEVMAIDWRHEGSPRGFDSGIVRAFPFLEIPLIAFGGISDSAQARELLALPRVAAVAIGNFLTHSEHAVQRIKAALEGLPIRPAAYAGLQENQRHG